MNTADVLIRHRRTDALVAAFAFLSGWFALRPHAPRAARAWLLGVLVMGGLFGTAQLLRGAHYPRHTMWSAWICWTACAVLSQVNSRFSHPAAAPVQPASRR